MPLFNVKCPNGHKSSILTFESSFDKIPSVKKKCKECGEEMVRDGTGPTSSVKEKLDNGLLVRAVERLAETERLYQERNSKADENAGRANRS